MLLIDGLSEAASDEEQQDRMQELRTEWNKEDSNNKNSKLTKS